MTPEELQAIRDEVAEDRLYHIAALEAENERMREIVAAVASASDLDRYAVCLWGCTHDGRGEGPHAADCPVTKARALLASERREGA